MKKDIYMTPTKKIALTFDDGYQYTIPLLEKLKAHGIKATFFPCGDWINSFPEEYQRIALDGHEIGNHSYHHFHMTELSDAEIHAEIYQVQELSRKLIGKCSRLFRFPYGDSNEHLIKLIKNQEFIPIKWSIDSRDWAGISAEKIYKNVVENSALKNGAIILMHTTSKHTLEALDMIIPALKKKGYIMVRVSELPSRQTCIISYFLFYIHQSFSALRGYLSALFK